jgi:hypothetical protein
MTITFGPSKSHPSYNAFFAQNGPLGDPFFGGYLICRNGGGTLWIVAPTSTQVSTTWDNRNAAVTSAESNAACGDWFVPTSGQLQDPGYCCKIYWDSSPSYLYWSNTNYNSQSAVAVNLTDGTTFLSSKTSPRPVRAFRCVFY